MCRFAKDFLLGATTAAHQVEGNNTNNDCWAQEQMPHSDYTEPSLDACDHYHRYEEDLRLMAKAGLNAYRFSLEWARIEPEAGRFDEAEIEHYRQVIACCKQNGIEPVVTLFHFTSPVWLIRQGGWEAESTVVAFARYTRHVMEQLGGELRYVCTINEANIGLLIRGYREEFARAQQADGLQMGMDFAHMEENRAHARRENEAVFGTAEPAIFTSPRTPAGDKLVMQAHQAARAVIRELCPHIKVGLSLSVHDLQPHPAEDAAAQAQVEQEWQHEFAHYLPYLEGDDFLGVQNYTRSLVGPTGKLPPPAGAELTQMGYEFYPEGLEHVLRRIAREFDGELLVTENGIATADDTRRAAFIERATAGVARCVADGLPVIGYCYWSLLDNFEWQKGYSQTFGLIAVDHQHGQTRTPKPSLYLLGALRR